MTVYATKVTQAYLNRRAAHEAGGSAINFPAGTVIVGDGSGNVPNISDLITANGVTHEVWRGTVVQSVSVNAITASEIDVKIVIPSTDGSGNEIGPFWVREFAITDENGVVMVVGTTQLEKSTGSANGQTSDLSWVAAIGESNSSTVVLTPPAAGYVTNVDVYNIVQGRTPLASQPLYRSDSTGDGHQLSTFHVETAVQPATLPADYTDPSKIGVGRPATDVEFAAGGPAQGSLTQWPWPTIAQVKSTVWTIGSGEGVSVTGAAAKTASLDYPDLTEKDALAANDLIAFYSIADGHHRKTTIGNLLPHVAIPGVVDPLTYDQAGNNYGIKGATTTQIGVGRSATSAEANARATTPNTGTAWVRPEDLPVLPQAPIYPTPPNPFPIGTQIKAARMTSPQMYLHQDVAASGGAQYELTVPATATTAAQTGPALNVADQHLYYGAIPGELLNVTAFGFLGNTNVNDARVALIAADWTVPGTPDGMGGTSPAQTGTAYEVFAVASSTWDGAELKLATLSHGVIHYADTGLTSVLQATAAFSWITLPAGSQWFFNGATYTRVS